jgi:UDP-N-acetylmuramoyl-tripeptide--D-alanyl-D-alanine ligase
MKPIKKIGKAVLCWKLKRQVLCLRQKHAITVVAVAGSVGKTSTKTAIAKVLGSQKRVRFQDGNYNDLLTVPLIFFGQPEPAIFNVWAWFKLLHDNARQIRGDYPYDIIVIELGTDRPGEMAQFAYLEPDIVVLTAIADEHMERFITLDAVAAEELAVKDYARKLLVNVDDVPEKYLKDLHYVAYSAHNRADYLIGSLHTIKLGQTEATLQLGSEAPLFVNLQLLGKQGAKIAVAAAAVAHLVGFEPPVIKQAVESLTAVPGRMQILNGIKNTTLIDDTYNASPIAVQAALDVLYAAPTKHRVAILGTMNELGEGSPAAHQAIGEYCNPKLLDMVLVVGSKAGKYLAPAAKKRGCTVKVFETPYEAGHYAAQNMPEGALVLAKGSQNGVFTEEALKLLLADPSDAQKLVRQTPYWLSKKKARFGDVPNVPQSTTSTKV